MPFYEKAIQIQLPWFGYGQGVKGQVRSNGLAAVVHHIAEGSFSTLCSRDFWGTRNGGSGGSVHFGVAKDGRVVQLVDIWDAAYGNGLIANPSWPWIAAHPGVNPNLATVSIEHEGFTGDPWPEAQVQATTELTRWILKWFGVKATTDTVIGHYRIDSVNRALCPGTGWPRDRIIAALNEEEDDLAGFSDEEKAFLHDLFGVRDQITFLDPEHKQVVTDLPATVAGLKSAVATLQAGAGGANETIEAHGKVLRRHTERLLYQGKWNTRQDNRLKALEDKAQVTPPPDTLGAPPEV